MQKMAIKKSFALLLLPLVAVVLPLGAANSAPKPIPKAPSEAFLGGANAKVTLIEYGSLTCVHCANFQKEVFPTIKAKYIDTGKIKYIFRTLPTNPIELATGLQVLADCAGGNKRYELIDEFYHQQDLIFAAAKSNAGPLSTALRIAKNKGLDNDKARACLNDDAMIENVRKIAEFGSLTYNINSTPSFVLNNKHIDDFTDDPHTIDGLSNILDNALKSTTKAKPLPKKAKRK